MFKQFSHAQLLPLSKTKRTSNMQAVKKKKKKKWEKNIPDGWWDSFYKSTVPQTDNKSVKSAELIREVYWAVVVSWCLQGYHIFYKFFLDLGQVKKIQYILL